MVRALVHLHACLHAAVVDCALHEDLTRHGILSPVGLPWCAERRPGEGHPMQRLELEALWGFCMSAPSAAHAKSRAISPVGHFCMGAQSAAQASIPAHLWGFFCMAAQSAAQAKDIIFDNDSRRRMQIGINKLADAVGVTLGPRGARPH